MNKVKLLIAESNFEEKTKLAQLFEAEEDFHVVGTADDGEAAIKLARSHKPNVIICNFALKNTDGITLCQKVKEESRDAKVIMLASAFSDTVVRMMVNSGVDCYFLRPFEAEALKRQTLSMVRDLDSERPDEASVRGNDSKNVPQPTRAGQVLSSAVGVLSQKKLDDRLSNIFFEIGISAHIKGFTYLREAVKICVVDQPIINHITKKLYPEVAKRHKTSHSKVERAIRHAIQVAWDRQRLHKINEIFGIHAVQKNDKPTNGEFISLLAERLIIENMQD